jgi:hypothetical protein
MLDIIKVENRFFHKYFQVRSTATRVKVKTGVVSELLISVGTGPSPWLRLRALLSLGLQLSPSELRSSLLRFCLMPESKSILLPGENSENSDP